MIEDSRFDDLVTRAHEAAARSPEGSYPFVFTRVLDHLVAIETQANTAQYRALMKIVQQARDGKTPAAEQRST